MRKRSTFKVQGSRLGFTLIEMVIGAGLFAAVIAGLAALFVGILRIQRQAFMESLVIDNARYAMEEMARAIRVSDIDAAIDGRVSSLALDRQPMLGGAFGCDDPLGCRVVYDRPDPPGNVVWETREDPVSGIVSLPLIGDSHIVAERFIADIQGCEAEGGNPRQPRVALSLRVRPLGASSAAALNLSTSVSLRQIQDTCN